MAIPENPWLASWKTLESIAASVSANALIATYFVQKFRPKVRLGYRLSRIDIAGFRFAR
jgi:hypothetical protein